MKLSLLAIKRPIATLMVVLLIVLLGGVSANRLNMDLFPNMSFPVAAVITSYPGVGPEEMENMISRPLEGVLGTTTNLKNISSVSRAGQSMIILEFNWGTDMDFATLEMREKIDMIKGMFPSEVSSPMVVKFDPSMLPIAQLGLSGSQDLVQLKNVAEKELIPRLERIDGVASVDLTGGLTREIRIEVDQKKLAQYGLELQTISTLLRMENLNLPAGQIQNNGFEYLVRMTGEFTNLDEIRQLILPAKQGLVTLGQIAEIRDTYQEVREIARMNGKPSVGITIQKQGDANTVRVTRRVMREMEKIREENPGLTITPIMNQSQYIEDSIRSVGLNAIFGGFLAVLILYFFLRNIRSTLIIGTAIPVSIIATFILVYFSGLTLNLMTLGGLALGIGMLVDNSIVVLENIYRFRNTGMDRIEAAGKGSNEVASAITASTLTTIIVFLPVVFVEGLASQLFNELALTVTFSLLASLVIALTFIPMLASQLLTLRRGRRSNGLEEKRLGWLRDLYERVLRIAVKFPWAVLLVVALLFGLGIGILPMIGTEFIPSMDQGEIRISLEMPLGTALGRTEEVVGQMEEVLIKMPVVESVFASIGSRGDMMMESSSRTEVGEIQVRLKPSRKEDTLTVVEEIREKFRDFQEAEIEVQAQEMMGGGGLFNKPITLEISGPDLVVLQNLANKIIVEMQQIRGIREVEHSMQEGRPELQIKIDRKKATQVGLQTARISMAVQAALQGETPTRFKIDSQEYDIRIQLKWDDRKNIQALENLLLSTPVGMQIPLKSIATFHKTEGPGLIERNNGSRIIQINAGLFDRDVGSANQEIRERLENVSLPTGYAISYGGQFEEMQSAFESLGFALILAVILVYMVLAAQFESLLYPLTIIFTVPLALTGAIFSLFLTGFTISVLAIIGMIMLAGIVVNNAIVLVDYINTLRQQGLDRMEAILKAGPVRLRPILMTTLTTVLGLLPLALGFGQGAEIQAPLAVVVIGGLTFSTVFTLIVVPAIYLVLDQFGQWLRRIYLRLQEE